MFTNRLSSETSPYLLQHAHNPVEWYPWGDEAIARAREEDKPILISIGYSACHWCHVMERESFEDPETAALMNLHFINIKIDREERPDLDHIYMDAVQAIAGNGGWPLNVFLTPEGKPFYGGTYYPPISLHNRPSWKSVLESISTAFREKRTEINEQADHLTKHIARSGFAVDSSGSGASLNKEEINELFGNLMKTADRVQGGFGAAPKFPQTFSIRYLLQHSWLTGDQGALEQACLSLDKMIYGGIYDQLGGGFARYSTDSEWLAPHFEKMLYDNALLITAMSEGYQMTGKKQYARAVQETIDFVQKELTSPESGFFSALDADSEGEEGKFYIWQKNEIDDLLGPDSAAFCTYFDVTERGNWEGKNILRVRDPRNSIPAAKLDEWKGKLMKHRSGRIRPQLDDKMLLGWNALMTSALCKAFAALGDKNYRELALRNIAFLEEKMQGLGPDRFYHSYSGRSGGSVGGGRIPAFLDDYAYLIDAYIQLQEVTGEADFLIRAKDLTEFVLVHFSEADTGYFYFTHQDQDDVIVRKREVYDGAVPSGNAVMAANLLYLGIIFDLEDWKKRAEGNAESLKEMVKRYPGSFGVWATLLNAFTYPFNEIILAGAFSEQNQLEFLAKGIPNRVFQVSSERHSGLPLLRNKPVTGGSEFFLCRDYSCQKPVKEVTELIRLLKNS